MAFDFKKEYKEFYLPKSRPQLVDIPLMNFVAVRGGGDPNAADGEYQRALKVLYTLAFTLKMSPRAGYEMAGFFDYVVPPLEGFWWQDNRAGIDYNHKERLRWISAIRLPDFVGREDLAWAVETAAQKKKLDCSAAEFMTFREGLCVQIMHLGSFDDEPATIELLEAFLRENGYVSDINENRRHHEIYMSDARRVAPERWRTVIRLPIKRI